VRLGPELLPTGRPEREVATAATTPTDWDDLDAAQRARAEALVRQEQPELTRLTQAQGAIWRQAVIAAAARLPTEQINTAATEESTRLTTGGAMLAQEKTS
jgi:hypothetical protein